jgi:hypothetical protein
MDRPAFAFVFQPVGFANVVASQVPQPVKLYIIGYGITCFQYIARTGATAIISHPDHEHLLESSPIPVEKNGPPRGAGRTPAGNKISSTVRHIWAKHFAYAVFPTEPAVLGNF